MGVNKAGRIGAAAVALLCAAAGSARADFNATTGRVELGRYPVSLGFDALDGPQALGRSLYLERDLSPVTPSAATILRDPAQAIEGQGALRLGQDAWGLVIGLDRVAFQLEGSSVRMTLWVRPMGTTVMADLIFERQEVGEGDPETLFYPAGEVRFMPTGRATDDGWRELSTGVVDFSQMGPLEARAIRIMDVRLPELLFFGTPGNNDSEVWLDGLSIELLGAQRVPPNACTLVDEAQQCGPQGACLMGRCVDAKLVVEGRPEDAEVRRIYLDRLGFRAGLLAGGRYTQAQAAAFRQRMSDVATAPSQVQAEAIYRRAFDDLGDGHVSAPLIRIGAPTPVSACLYMAEADLMPQGGLLPMVLELEPSLATEGLEIGDVLVAVDGLAPEVWLARADRLLSYTGDPRGRTFILTPELWRAAMRTGARLTFQRCRGPGRCDPNNLQTVQVDLAQVGAAFWAGQPVDAGSGDLFCDYRFQRPVEGPNVRETDFVGFSDSGGIRSILLNGVDGFGAWQVGAQASLRNLPPKVLLDQRTGFGGTFDGVSTMLSPFISVVQDPWVNIAPQFAPEASLGEMEQLLACQENGGFYCANFFALPLVGSSGPVGARAEAKVAVLDGFDVSGNDFLPKALKMRTQGQTRIFGAVPTFGAFGPIYVFPRIMDEFYGGTGQLHDTTFLVSPDAQTLDFNTGYGVEPDEVVLQRQSDAVRGVDTLIAAARAWLEATP